MQDNLEFSDFFNNILYKFESSNLQSKLFSFSTEIPCFELIDVYPLLMDKYRFSIFWNEDHTSSYIALGKCKKINLNGPHRFTEAKEFNNKIFNDILNLDDELNNYSIPKIFYFFTFKDYASNNNAINYISGLEGVLPKILIINNGTNTFLRMHINGIHKSQLRLQLEEFWKIKNLILNKKLNKKIYDFKIFKKQNFYQVFDKEKDNLRKKISKGIQLIKDEKVEKLVLSSKLILNLHKEFRLNKILKTFKINHPNSCIYVWKRNHEDITFGASPEKLFSFNNHILTLEAIAGTAKNDNNAWELIKSSKNVREHYFVINYLIDKLQSLHINNFKKGDLQVKSFGNIVHLSTKITASQKNICPFKLLTVLHPSPAVCGTPTDISLKCIELIESFDRVNYGSPIGWVDCKGNSDFRVALRGARMIGNNIEIVAGSGLVKGSICEEEIEEIKLKFESVINHIVL